MYRQSSGLPTDRGQDRGGHYSRRPEIRAMVQGYAYTTVKKVHILLNEYFRYLTEEGFIQKNPMQSVPMMKKSNFLAA